MANHKSSKKKIRQISRRTQVNRIRRTSIRSSVKEVEIAIESGDKNKATEAFKKVEPKLMKGVNKNIVKLNTAARKISRLSQRIKNMS